MNKEEELKELNKQMIMLNIIDAPGAILAGLGLYGVFGANGDAFIDILNNQNVAIGAIVVGVAIMGWSMTKLLPLMKRRAELMSQQDS